jgi:hypothetical protein
MKNRDDLLTGLGRFSEPALYVLISLADGPKHGYAMTQDIEAVSGQKLGPGTLYGAIAANRRAAPALPPHGGGPARAPLPPGEPAGCRSCGSGKACGGMSSIDDALR